MPAGNHLPAKWLRLYAHNNTGNPTRQPVSQTTHGRQLVMKSTWSTNPPNQASRVLRLLPIAGECHEAAVIDDFQRRQPTAVAQCDRRARPVSVVSGDPYTGNCCLPAR
jgi:hypothetical protein